MTKFKKLAASALAAVSAAAGLLSTGVVASGAVAADQWELYSAYSFDEPNLTSISATYWRVTFKVPAGVTSVLTTPSANQAYGPVPVHAGYAAVDLFPGAPARRQLDVHVEGSNGSEWDVTVPAPPPAVPTQLTITSVLPKSAPNGRDLEITGTLTASGKPVVGHWVNLFDQKVERCQSDGTACQHVEGYALGSAKVTNDGTWRVMVPARWDTNPVATYCSTAELCYGNPNAPAYVAGTPFSVTWAPKIGRLPRVTAGRKATYTVTAPWTLPSNDPVVGFVQTYRGDSWVNLAKATLQASTIELLAGHVTIALPAGKHQLRAFIPRTEFKRDRWSVGQVLETGYSKPATVKVAKRVGP